MTHAMREGQPWWRARGLGFAASQPVSAEAPASLAHGEAIASSRSWRERAFSQVDPVLLGMLALTIVGLMLRLYGLNWDANNHLHPDERAIVFKALCLAFPGQPRGESCDPTVSGPGWFFSPDSPLNPHFFAYGSFPLYLLALVANGLAALTQVTGGRFLPSDGGVWNDFNHVTLVGRALSALFDSGSILLSGLLARKLAGPVAGLLAAAFVMVIPFDIQVSHFYAVDTILLFFVLLTLLCAVSLARATTSREATFWGIASGVATGLAIATKVSALPLALPVVLAAALVWRRRGLGLAFSALVGGVAATLITFAVTSPYALIDNAAFRAQTTEQTLLSQGKLDYPYVRQFADTAPYLYPIQQMLRYNVGAPLTLLGLAGVAWVAWRLWRSLDDDWLIIVGWVAVYFGIVGGAYMKFGRYMLPVYAPLAILGAGALVAAWRALRHACEAGAAEGERTSLLGRVRSWAGRLDLLWWRVVAAGIVALVLGSTALNALAIDNLYSTPNTRVQASTWLFDHIPAGTLLTNEIWDDPLPISVPPARIVDGKPLTAAGHLIDQYQYPQTGLDLYNDDTPDKAAKLAQQLVSAEVVVISSQRLLTSIPKLPDRYPMTIRYYQLLFAGKLGFTLTKTFQEQPHVLGYMLDDRGADESFSVYDHPPVWIFTRSGPPLTTAQITTLLTQDLPLPAQPLRPGSEKSLLLTPDQEAANAATLPLGIQFPADSLASRFAPLWWLLVIELLGLAAFPLAYFAFPGLRDRGWGVSKVLGIIALAWLVWMPASLKVLPFDRWVVGAAFLLLVVSGVALAWWRRLDLLAFLRTHWRLVVAAEAAFVLAYAFFCWIRALDPDLWHIYRGGEKPMELAYLNGILRSRYMPPADPWFAGGYINYYYYGQFIIATLIKLTGIAPTTAFNLAVALLFALAFSAAFSVGAGLTGRVWVGLAAGVGLVVLGNLEGVWQLVGQWQAISHHQAPPPYDYWASSRVIPCLGKRGIANAPCYDTTINEFPYWSFLYADLHAHLIALPIVVTISAGCASLVASARDQLRAWRPALLTLGVLAFSLGTALVVNTWDVPAYAALIGLALLIRVMPLEEGPAGWAITRALWPWARLRNLLAAFVAVVAMGYLLYIPFTSHFQSFVSGIGSQDGATSSYQFLAIFGLWLFLLVSFFVMEAFEALSAVAGGALPLAWRLGIIVAGVLALVLSLVSLKAFFLLVLLAGIALALILPMTQRRLFTYVVLLLGVVIALGVELVYVRDFLDGSPYERMNTVFKFYYEVWTLLALGGVIAFAWIFPRLRAPVPARQALLPAVRLLWVAVLVVLVAGSSIFLVQGTAARVQDPAIWAQQQPPPGGVQPVGLSLDGMAYMRGWYPGDYEAITWVNEHVGGMPVLVEANLGMYTWSGRVSIYTGLPDVVQTGHEHEQRYGAVQPHGDQITPRVNAVTSFWATGNPREASQFLRTYHVRYVYLGQLERTCYTMVSGGCQPLPAAALAKFDTLRAQGVLMPVYAKSDVIIYQVVAP